MTARAGFGRQLRALIEFLSNLHSLAVCSTNGRVLVQLTHSPMVFPHCDTTPRAIR